MKKQLLLFVMILAFANIPNYAQTVVNVNGLRFQIENGNAIVGRQDRELSGDIVIPSSIDYEGQTYSVTGIVGPIDTHSYGGMSSISADEAAFQGTAITSVTLPTTITNINTCAFINCSYLQKVVLPEGITSIGWGAFAYCSSLTEINLPNSLQSLSAWSFGGCSSLKSINIPENITNLPDAVFKNCGFESFDIPAQITRLGRESLNMYGLKSVKSYIRDITRIYYHDECFGNVTDKTLYIPNGSRFIYQEYNPWRKFATIEEFDDGHTGEPINPIELIATVNDIRYKIFDDGTAILIQQNESLSGEIVIPETITVGEKSYTVNGIIGPNDTHSWGGMNSISADGAAFQGTTITSITLPATITTINTCAFINCSYLQKVVLPEGITSIGWGAFAYCSSLTEINLPNSLQSLSAWSFGGCSSLKSINIPENITNLPDAVFKNCGFESFDIPAQITRLGRESLNMYGLKSVKSYIRDITRIYYHDECFGNVTDKTLYIPNGSRFIYQEYNPWRKFATIEEFDDGHTGEPINPIELIATVNDIRYKIFDDGTAILIQQNESLSGEIVIPETITVGEKSYTVNGIIGPNDTHSWGNMNSISADGAAFQGTAITSITLPTTISNINTCAFINCSKLQKVVLPETITSIGWGAFAYCSSLTEINLPNSLQSLSAWAFAGCRELKQIAIPKQITTLPSACFKESGLNYIDIPENVVSMQKLCLNTSSLSYVKIYQSDINLIWTSDNAFGTYDNIQNTDLFVPRGCKTNYIQTYPWAKFRSIDEFGFIVNIDNNDGGKITASKTIVLYNDEKIRLTISPNTGYSLESLSINGIDVTKDIVNGEYIVSDINEDLNIVGVFIINKYKLTYTVDGEEYKSSEVEYGATITAEEAPTKEGYTFSGWSEIPETMPAHDVTVTGTFSINKYKLTYTVDGTEYKTYEIKYNSTITAESEPTKEGYTFSGWSEIPSTMPPYDVTVTGSFNINSYKLTYMIDEKVYKETMYEYGATITPEPAPDGDFVNFEWIELPETMPAHDVIVTGTYEKAFIPGDANGDGLVNVTDIVSTVNYIMENPSDNFNKDAADLNGDGIVNVTDIVQMVNIIMNGNGASSRRAAATSSNLIISGNNIQLRNAETYTAAQFDINLSDGQSISNIVLNCSSNHSLSWKMIDANTCRVVAYSMTNATFCANSDNLFDISLSGDQDVTISNELLVEADGTTGIDVIRREAENGKIYDLNGRQVKNPRKGLYIINGRKVIVK